MRGIFLFVVIWWYSVAMWKVIDEYFKDQFTTFLFREFQNKPGQVQDDLKKSIETVEREVSKLDEFYDNSKNRQDFMEFNDKEDRVSSKAEILVTKTDETDSETPAPDVWNCYEEPSWPMDEDDLISYNDDYEQENLYRFSEYEGQKLKIGAMTQDEASIYAENTKNGQLRYVDYDDVDDNEFAEFAESDDKRKSYEFEKDYEEVFVKVDQLPYKPAVDIYGVEKVSTSEYCPLSREEDAQCEAPTYWP